MYPYILQETWQAKIYIHQPSFTLVNALETMQVVSGQWHVSRSLCCFQLVSLKEICVSFTPDITVDNS